MKPDIGIPGKSRDKIVDLLQASLADTFVLYSKTRNAHWNVTGPHFNHLHKFFESQYDQLDDAVDDLAERIRSLGVAAAGSLKEFLELTRLKEVPGAEADGARWIEILRADHEAVIRQLRKDVAETAKLGDAGTSDFLTGLMEAHEKMAWMLRASS